MRIFLTLLFVALAPLTLAGLSPEDRAAAVRDLQQGRADDAMQLLQAATAAGSHDAEAHQLLCRLNLQLEGWNDAVAACGKAVALDGGSSNNHLWFGRALGEKADRSSFVRAYGLGKRVKTEFETAVSLDPRNAEALSDLGEYYTDAPAIVGGGKDKAAAVADKLDALDRARAEELRGQIAVSNKDNAAAEEHYRNAIASAQHPASYWMVLGSYYQRHQDNERMRQAIHSGLAADGAHGTPLVDAAQLLTRAGDGSQIPVTLLRQYVALPNKSEEEPAFRVHLLLAALLNKQGDTAGAEREIQAASAIASIYHPSKPVATNTGR